MAEWKGEAPRSLAEWAAFHQWATLAGRWSDWKLFPPQLREYPEGYVPERWEPTAEDHPFKGTQWCWRCLTEATGWRPTGEVSHCRPGTGICWYQATISFSAAQNAVQDTRPTGDPNSSDWTAAGRQYVAEAVEGSKAVDTGTIFYDPPAKPIEGTRVRITPVDSQGRPVGPTQEGIVQGLNLRTPAVSIEEVTPWDGWPSWTDDLPLSDIPQWPPPSVEIPLSKDAFEALHGSVEAGPEGGAAALPPVPNGPSPDAGSPADS